LPYVQNWLTSGIVSSTTFQNLPSSRA